MGRSTQTTGQYKWSLLVVFALGASEELVKQPILSMKLLTWGITACVPHVNRRLKMVLYTFRRTWGTPGEVAAASAHFTRSYFPFRCYSRWVLANVEAASWLSGHYELVQNS